MQIRREFFLYAAFLMLQQGAGWEAVTSIQTIRLGQPGRFDARLEAAQAEVR